MIDLAQIIAAKRAEFEATGIDLNPWRYQWPLGPFPVDERRTAPHGDPLFEAVTRGKLDRPSHGRRP